MQVRSAVLRFVVVVGNMLSMTAMSKVLADILLYNAVGALYGFNVNFAYMFTEWVGLGFYFIQGNAAWRVLLGIQLVPACGMLLASFWMPFSPRWYA